MRPQTHFQRILILFAAGLFLYARASSAQPASFSASPDFQNRIYATGPFFVPNANVTQAKAVTMLSGGSAGSVGNLSTLSTNTIILARWSAGHPVATSLPPLMLTTLDNSPYHNWLRSHFAADELGDYSNILTRWGLFADPDNDGQPNLVEFALGTNPLQPDDRLSSERIRAWTEEANGMRVANLTFFRRKAPWNYNLEYGVFHSPTLGSTLSLTPAGESISNLPLWNDQSTNYYRLRDVDTVFEEVHYRQEIPVGSTNSLFLAVRFRDTQVSPPTLTLAGIDEDDVFILGKPIPLYVDAGSLSGGIVRLEFYIDGQLIRTLPPGQRGILWTNTVLGTNLLTIRAVDSFGVTKTITRPLVTDLDSDNDGIANMRDRRPGIPNLAPEITLISFSSSANFHNIGPVSIAAAAIDADGDAAFFSFYVADGPMVAAARDFGVGNTFSFTPLAQDSGYRTVTVQARDKWAVGSPTSKPLYIFKTPPIPTAAP